VGWLEVTKKEKKNFPKSETGDLKQQVRSLKAKLRNRDKKIEIMKSELRTLQRALDESIVYINDELEQIPVEDLVRYFNRKKKGKLDEVQESYYNQMEKLKEDWKCYKCDHGYLKIVKIKRPDGMYYFRACVDCPNKTKLKKYTDDVEGIHD
jgi:predicted RNase H-like nuclease (RuvC/YqgF family)